MPFDLDKYIDDFNSYDEEIVVREYYAEDSVVEGPDHVKRGRNEWIALLKAMHVGIKEELTPRLVVQQDDILMAEVDATFTATADRPDFIYGPLKEGESVTVRFFASYTLRDALITRLALAWWPPFGTR